MFKKVLTILLAVCMLSVSAFASTAMLSLETDYESASSATTPAEETVTPEVVYVTSVTSGADTTQTINYYQNSNDAKGLKTNTNITTDAVYGKRWFYFKMPLEGLSSVSAAQFDTNMRYNSGATFYIRALDESVWTAATTGLTDNTKTLVSTNGDTPLSVPNGNVLASLKDAMGNTAADYSFTEEALTEYINLAASEGESYVYFAVYFHTNSTKASDGCSFYSASLTLSGAKAVEGISASIVAEKTDAIYFTNAENIAYLMKGSEGNQYTSAGNYKVTTYKGTYNSVDYDLDNILYLKADLSAYMDKEIESIEFVSRHRENKSANTIYVGQTETGWNSESITYESKPASLSSGILFGGGTGWSEPSISVKPFLDNVGDDGILSLSISANVGATTTNFYGAEIYGVGKSEEGLSPHLIITYKDAVGASEPVTDEFTYQATIATEGATARLLVGIYGENDVFLGAIASGILTSDGETPLVLPVDLSEYPTATYIKAYMWNGTTLVPYFTPILRTVTVTQ